MAHFYGQLKGNRGMATRAGSKESGYLAIAASWEGCVTVDLYHDKERGCDMARVTLDKWYGQGCWPPRVLYDGPVSGAPCA